MGVQPERPVPHDPESVVDAPEEAASGRLVSFADMATLLFGFVVIVLSFGSHEDTSHLERGARPLERLESVLRTYSEKPGPLGPVNVAAAGDRLEITLGASELFEGGTSRIKASARVALAELVREIDGARSGTELFVRIEGHTDDVPVVKNRHLYATNLELSSSRAAAIREVFEGAGFSSDCLVAAGFGSSRPDVPNRSPAGEALRENQARNRRMVVQISPRAFLKAE